MLPLMLVGGLAAAVAFQSSAEARGWVKIEQTTQQVLSTANVAVMLMPNGTLWAADLNAQGLIDAQAIFKPMVKQNGQLLTGVVEVVAGEGHVLARLANGEVWAAGENSRGQLADGTAQTRARFVPCVTTKGDRVQQAAAIVAGRDHSMVLLESGVVLTSGANQHGQLGQGHWRDSLGFAPTLWSDLTSVSHIVGIEAHDDYSLILRGDETRWMAGRYPKLSIKPGGKIITYNAFIEF